MKITNAAIEKLEKEIEQKQAELLKLRKKHFNEDVKDYLFTTSEGDKISLSQLFGDKKDLIVIHNMGKSCPYCTLWADGFNGVLDHLEDRAAIVLCSPDAPEVQKAFVVSRDWNFTVISSQNTTFLKDMGFEDEKKQPYPGVSAFAKKGNKIVRIAADQFGPGDSYCAVWHMFDLLKDGANKWEPKYSY